ncbi:hypothetical protein NEOLEDRAFT_515688 [Neolentinus lepideus HHB14362 ss-1]|uniref:Uncharacterized protein n=1 Tax=Neolentinus lepideus HHB14362 ss-1 TaxID=1314782 RepID=A0A165RH93_9AGAM|nr:hypothetical protein NEOLEDRAFT_515688 [Neolentinus lepideus HHB14362 ss-1]
MDGRCRCRLVSMRFIPLYCIEKVQCYGGCKMGCEKASPFSIRSTICADAQIFVRSVQRSWTLLAHLRNRAHLLLAHQLCGLAGFIWSPHFATTRVDYWHHFRTGDGSACSEIHGRSAAYWLKHRYIVSRTSVPLCGVPSSRCRQEMSSNTGNQPRVCCSRYSKDCNTQPSSRLAICWILPTERMVKGGLCNAMREVRLTSA